MSAKETWSVWFVTGSQPLYGPETLKTVAEHARSMVDGFNASGDLPLDLVFTPIVTTPEEILATFRRANATPGCAGIVTWMHTFSPSKMWIAGLAENHKPLLHLHTQYNRDIPWASIDMDFMNLNQSAHGDREHGFIQTRMKIARKVVVGHWQDPEVRDRMGAWMRAAAAFADGKDLKVCRFGDNMREVAVTEGDKVAAQIQLGWSVNGWGLGDLVRKADQVSDAEIDRLVAVYGERYELPADVLPGTEGHKRLREQAHIELAMRAHLESVGAKAFTTTFEDLTGLPQLPGLASQRLMESGYGFGGEGDWKTSALVRALKVMNEGLPGGTSFMEDYTYHFEPGNELVLGAHMLEICPTIARGRPRIEVHPLGIGGKADPARMVFEATTGSALNATLLDLGDRFRLLVNEVESVPLPQPMPKLPVARVLWKPFPGLKDAARLWILAGGAHHTAFSTAVTSEMLEDYATMAGIEFFRIGKDDNAAMLERMLRWNASSWK